MSSIGRCQTGRLRPNCYLFHTPADVPDLELTMLWHGRFNEDPGLAWLRGLIVEVSTFDDRPAP